MKIYVVLQAMRIYFTASSLEFVPPRLPQYCIFQWFFKELTMFNQNTPSSENTLNKIKKTKRLTMLMAFVGLVTTSSLSAQAQNTPPVAHVQAMAENGYDAPNGEDHVQSMHQHFQHLIRAAQPTKEQNRQIAEIMQKARSDMASLHVQSQTAHERLMQLMTASNLDESQIAAQQNVVQAHQLQVMKRMQQATLEVMRLFTPEQRQQLAQAAKMDSPHMHKMHHHPAMMQGESGYGHDHGQAPTSDSGK